MACTDEVYFHCSVEWILLVLDVAFSNYLRYL
jgi:hypothetical protein